jgi:hypothetical protein
MKKILAGLTLLLALQTLHAHSVYTLSMTIAGSKNDSIVTRDGKARIETKEGNVTFHVPMELASPATQVEQSQHLTFPASYAPAHRAPSEVALPMTPKTFTKLDLGWKITTCVEAERDGIVAIRGEATYTQPVLEEKGAFGEESLIENRSTSFSTIATTSHFYLFARPGQSYAVPLKQGAETVQAEVTCTVGDTVGKAVAQR